MGMFASADQLANRYAKVFLIDGDGNRNLAMARKVGGASLTFTYCVLPATEQADVERILIAALGVANFANLRREGLYEDQL